MICSSQGRIIEADSLISFSKGSLNSFIRLPFYLRIFTGVALSDTSPSASSTTASCSLSHLYRDMSCSRMVSSSCYFPAPRSFAAYRDAHLLLFMTFQVSFMDLINSSIAPSSPPIPLKIPSTYSLSSIII